MDITDFCSEESRLIRILILNTPFGSFDSSETFNNRFATHITSEASPVEKRLWLNNNRLSFQYSFSSRLCALRCSFSRRLTKFAAHCAALKSPPSSSSRHFTNLQISLIKLLRSQPLPFAPNPPPSNTHHRIIPHFTNIMALQTNGTLLRTRMSHAQGSSSFTWTTWIIRDRAVLHHPHRHCFFEFFADGVALRRGKALHGWILWHFRGDAGVGVGVGGGGLIVG